MRTRLLSLITIAAVAFTSCQKEKQQKTVAQVNPINPLVGTWSIVKISSTVVDSNGKQVNANYQQPLNAANIITFSQDSLCVWNTDHFYMYGENGNGIIQQAGFKSLTLRYSAQGKLITLSPPFQGPMGAMAYTEEETATMPSANSLIIHSTYIINDGSTVTADTYYTK